MTKTLTEQWREGTLSLNYYDIKLQSGKYGIDHTVMSIDGDLPKTKFAYSNFAIEEVLAPVPSYRALYGPNDGNMPTGVFTVLKIIKENIDITQKQRRLTDLECGIKSQIVSLLKRWGVK